MSQDKCDIYHKALEAQLFSKKATSLQGPGKLSHPLCILKSSFHSQAAAHVGISM